MRVLTKRHGGCTFTLTPNADGTQFPKWMARQTPTRLARKRRTCRRLALSCTSVKGETASRSSDDDVAAQKAVGVAEQNRLAPLRSAAMRLWIVFGNESRVAQCVDREVDRGVDVVGLQRSAGIEVLRPGSAHA